MGFFDGHFTNYDWNGDGKVDSWDDVMELTMIQQQIDEQNREERINTMVHAITADGESKQIGNEEFAELCDQTGLNMNDFEQSDIDEIQRRLNRWGY